MNVSVSLNKCDNKHEDVNFFFFFLSRVISSRLSKLSSSQSIVLGKMEQTYNPGTWEAEAGNCCKFEASLNCTSSSQPRLYNKTLSQNAEQS